MHDQAEDEDRQHDQVAGGEQAPPEDGFVGLEFENRRRQRLRVTTGQDDSEQGAQYRTAHGYMIKTSQDSPPQVEQVHLTPKHNSVRCSLLSAPKPLGRFDALFIAPGACACMEERERETIVHCLHRPTPARGDVYAALFETRARDDVRRRRDAEKEGLPIVSTMLWRGKAVSLSVRWQK